MDTYRRTMMNTIRGALVISFLTLLFFSPLRAAEGTRVIEGMSVRMQVDGMI